MMREKPFTEIGKIIAGVLFFLFIFMFFYLPIEIGDIGWHLSTGKWIVEEGAFPKEDIFSFTDIAAPRIESQWLGSSLYYAVYKMGGVQGLKVFRAGIFLLIVLIFFCFAYRKIPFPILLFLCLLLSFALYTRCLLRPLSFNFIFIQIFLICLFSYEFRHDRRSLYVLPLLGIIWSNMHLGSFVYAVLIVLMFLFSNCVLYGKAIIKKQTNEQKSSLIKIRDLTVLTVVYLCSFFINPYGLEGAMQPIKVFLIPLLSGFQSFNSFNEEFQPPVYILSAKALWFYVLLVLGIVGLLSSKKKSILLYLLFFISLFLFLRAARGSVFFAIMSLYVIALCAQDLSALTRWKTLKYSKLINVLVGIFIIGAMGFYSNKFYKDKVFVNGKILNTRNLVYVPGNPISAIEFMKENNLSGRIFNSDRWGGQILWSAYPQLKPFVDGRQVDAEIFQLYLAILGNPELYWPQAQEKYQFNMALLNAAHASSLDTIEYLQKLSSWQLVYIDGTSILFVKRGAFKLSKEVNDLENQWSSAQVKIEDIERLREVAATKPKSSIEQFLNPAPVYNDLALEAVTLIGIGYYGEGVGRLVQSAEEAIDPNIVRISNAVLEIYTRDGWE